MDIAHEHAYVLMEKDKKSFAVEDGCYVFHTDDSREISIPTEDIDVTEPECFVEVDNKVFRLHMKANRARIVTLNPPPKIVWNDDATKLLITLYPEMKSKLDAREITSVHGMYEKISEELCKHGYQFSGLQVNNRWKTLERSYRNMQKVSVDPRRPRKPLYFAKELMEIFPKIRKKQATIVPVPECADTEYEQTQDGTDCRLGSTASTSNSNVQKPMAHLRERSAYNELRKLRAEVEKYRTAAANEKLQWQQSREVYRNKKLQLMEERNVELKRRNDLFAKFVQSKTGNNSGDSDCF